MERTRTFIALETNEALQRHLTNSIDQVAQLLPTVRWVDPLSLHLTLAFLGELSHELLVDAIQATQMAAQQVQPFRYQLSHLGMFGSPRHPRVIWMGIEEEVSGSLAAVHHQLSQQLRQHGFAIDPRPFSPHLTLARLKAPLSSSELQQLHSLLANKQRIAVSAEMYVVHHLAVMKSQLQRAGAHYSCVQSCPVGRD